MLKHKINKKPIIGIVTRADHLDTKDELPQYVVLQQYIKALTPLDACIILIPPQDSYCLSEIFNTIHGLLLAGGGDISRDATEKISFTEPTRDTTEIYLTQRAFHEKMPILGICRGLQIINVALGGTLYDDIHSMRPDSLNHVSDWRSGKQFVHTVRIMPGTILARLIDGQKVVRVNGNHHQAIKTLSPELVVSAIAPDGIIESAECKSRRFVMGVQWHPEWLLDFSDKLSTRLFSSFVGAVFEYAGLNLPSSILDIMESQEP